MFFLLPENGHAPRPFRLVPPDRRFFRRGLLARRLFLLNVSSSLLLFIPSILPSIAISDLFRFFELLCLPVPAAPLFLGCSNCHDGAAFFIASLYLIPCSLAYFMQCMIHGEGMLLMNGDGRVLFINLLSKLNTVHRDFYFYLFLFFTDGMMGNQGSPYPSFFNYDDFTSFVVMACCAAPFYCARSLCALRARAKRAHHMKRKIKHMRTAQRAERSKP